MDQTPPPTFRAHLLAFLRNRRLLANLLIGELTIVAILLWGIWLVNVPSFPEWLGFNGKTLWDVIVVALIPLAIFFAGVVISWQQKRVELASATAERENDRQIAREREEEAALQSYYTQMSDLLLNHQLRKKSAEEDAEERSVARALTLATLRRLNGERKGMLVRFLSEAGLVTHLKSSTALTNAPSISLAGADLRGANLNHVNLNGIDLSGADLCKARLRQADLRRADLGGADLSGADLRAARLHGAELGGAELEGANLKLADLREVNFGFATLRGADLREASLRGAKFGFVNLDGAKLEGATIDSQTEGFPPDLVAKLMADSPQPDAAPPANLTSPLPAPIEPRSIPVPALKKPRRSPARRQRKA